MYLPPFCIPVWNPAPTISVILRRQTGESRTECIALENLSQTPNFRVSHLHLSSNKTPSGSKSVEDFAVTLRMVRHGEDGIEKNNV